MIKKEEWNKLKANELYGMYADNIDKIRALEKRLDGALQENYELYKSVNKLTKLVNELTTTTFSNEEKIKVLKGQVKANFFRLEDIERKVR